MTQGWFNHYDDPDEFWDEEPLEVKRAPEPPVIESAAAASSVRSTVVESPTDPLFGAGIFTMRLDSRHLPVEVEINRGIHNRIAPGNFSAAAMTGYHLAMWGVSASVIAKKGLFSELSARPTRRNEMIALLEARSRPQFEFVERAVGGRAVFKADGPSTEYGTPSLSVVASLSWITSISIDPQWAATASAFHLRADILGCVDQIRRQRPTFGGSGSWATRTDEELERELRNYREYLMRSQ